MVTSIHTISRKRMNVLDGILDRKPLESLGKGVDERLMLIHPGPYVTADCAWRVSASGTPRHGTIYGTTTRGLCPMATYACGSQLGWVEGYCPQPCHSTISGHSRVPRVSTRQFHHGVFASTHSSVFAGSHPMRVLSASPETFLRMPSRL